MKALGVVMVAVMLVGCSSVPERMEKFSYEPAYLAGIGQKPMPKNGSLFQDQNGLSLWDDARAHRVGDIITINLVETFRAKKNDESKYSRNNDIDPGGVSLFGRTDSQILKEAAGVFSPLRVTGSKTAFQGKSNVKQDSSIDGKIAVMVTEVLPNGNLVIRGEKWITISDGEEVVRFAGIIRPQDIQPDNTIDSTKVADVRLIYKDTGYAGMINRPSAVQQWLAKYWPF